MTIELLFLLLFFSREEVSPAEPGYELMTDGTLMVEAPSLDPVGAYACMAKSPMGEAKSRVARLVTSKRRGESMPWLLLAIRRIFQKGFGRCTVHIVTE